MELCRLEQLPHDSTRRQLVQMFIHLGGGVADVRALWPLFYQEIAVLPLSLYVALYL